MKTRLRLTDVNILWLFILTRTTAVYGLPGYSLKGLEKGLSKRHLTKLKAEIILIRMRTAIDDFRSSTPEERAAVVEAWKSRC